MPAPTALSPFAAVAEVHGVAAAVAWTLASAAGRQGLVVSPAGALAEWWREVATPLAAVAGPGLFEAVGPPAPAVLDALAPEGEAVVTDPGVLGERYASALRGDDRKRRGVFYTPRSVADLTLDAWAPTLHVGPTLHPRDRLLDPACGGGRFLLAALDRLLPARGALGPAPETNSAPRDGFRPAERDRFTVVSETRFIMNALERVRGYDTDPLAAGVARLAILLRLARAAREASGHDTAALLRLPWAEVVQVRNLLAEHGQPGGAAYDCVVGNPPYRAGRLTPVRDLPPDTRARFRAAQYQVDPFVLFIEAGLGQLRPGGTLSLIVPNSFMSNLRGNALRRILGAENCVLGIVELPAETFGAGVETVILRVTRGGATPVRVPVARWVIGPPLRPAGLPAIAQPPGSCPPAIPQPPGSCPPAIAQPPGSCPPAIGRLQAAGTLLVDAADRGAPWPLLRPGRAPAVLGVHRGPTLGDVADITRGVNPYHHTRHSPAEIAGRIHHADHFAGPGFVPELRGRDLQPLRVAWDGRRWLRYGPWLKEPRDPRFFDGPRILVRKILGPTLVAAYLDTPFVCDQSVYIAHLKPGQPWPPLALLACISSPVVAEILRTRHQEDDRLFPQLKVAELRGLPLPALDVAGADAGRLGVVAESVAAVIAGTGARETLDTLVAALYGVSPPA